jgi:N-acetyl-gamma-glutamyl-phosphate reductase
MSEIRVGIAGATGYGGQELLRILARHPHARVTAAMSSGSTDRALTLPALTGVWDGEITPFSMETLTRDTDVVFLALPENASAAFAPALVESGVRVLDLSGSFRLQDDTARARWYPETPSLIDDLGVVYGLTERRRAALPDARLIACPGCYPTAALLALEPLIEAGLVEGDVAIDAKSGISGAGKKPSERTHFSECHGNVAAYEIFTHRHGAEIEQQLGRTVTFVPHLVPLDRGIEETIYTRVPSGTTARTVRDLLERAYATAPFVRLRGDALPEIKHVVHTNFCDIGWVLDEAGERLVLVSCVDNLVKGAAGQAVQNFNVALGLDEREGLG